MKTGDRKRIVSRGGGCLLSFFLVLLLLGAPPEKAAAAQTEEERTAGLVEGAKKEGKLVWYTTMPVDVAPKFVKRFREKYPFIDVEIFRSGQEKVVIKILAEAQARRHAFDVVTVNAIASVALQAKGIYAKYPSPQREFYSEGAKDAEGYWTDTFLNLNTIGYNTRLISSREAPKTWQDLIDPKWKGRLGMDTKPIYWFAGMLKLMGEKKGLEYMEKLSRQGIQFRTGRTLNTQMMAAGEISVGVTLYNYMVEEMKQKGAPIEWVAIEPVIPEPFPLSISAHAPHHHAAKLFVDFMLSREGQEIMAGTFRIPARTDVDAMVPKLKKGLKILPFDVTIARDYERYAKLFRDTMMKR